MKRILACILCVALLLTGATAFAYDYSPQFWTNYEMYEKALQNKNYNDIIEYGNNVISYMASAREGTVNSQVLAECYKQVGIALAETGDFLGAVNMFESLYAYAQRYGDTYSNYMLTAKTRIDQYTPVIDVYTTGGNPVYFGEENEVRNGVLFGTCANGESRNKIGNESMVLTYQELGQELLAYNKGVFQKAGPGGYAVEFALNCPKENDDIENIHKMDSYLKDISALFKQYKKVPVFLRFGAEFNSWQNPSGPEDYIYAFRYVAEYFKDRNDNVAIVWSPNYASSADIDLRDYYPGDEYVDWVGVSLYAQKYFMGDNNQSEENQIVFKTGASSDPVIAIKEIVEEYGDRKPIMISESGCGHKMVKSGEDTTDFALTRLKQYYSYLPMVYPQIKLMAHFDYLVKSDREHCDYRLSSNSQIQKEYIRLVSGPRFIQNTFQGEVDTCYRKIDDATVVDNVFEVSCYAHMYDSEITKVSYFLDDKYVAMATEIPFTAFIDAGGKSGRHTLKTVASLENGKTLETSHDIRINDTASSVAVEISDRTVKFDQDPIVYNSRTMVPLRKIFEELGASVSWNNDTKTVTGKKGDRIVTLSLGNKNMYVNGRVIELDTAPIAVSDRTLVPVRAVAEGLGCDVEWDGKNGVVSITPKVAEWSQWDTVLPEDVKSDLYYIESRTEYSYRTRTRKYFTSDEKQYGYRLEDSDVSYGQWSGWDNEYISENQDREVETRTVSEPKEYHYIHYCTGSTAEKGNRYKTSSTRWCDECDFHDFGWTTELLDKAPDGTGYIKYDSDGDEVRCSNTCYRRYIIETRGGEYTQYRYRPIYREYTYSYWTDWSYWTRWSEEDPEDEYWGKNVELDIDERTVYRYKEK